MIDPNESPAAPAAPLSRPQAAPVPAAAVSLEDFAIAARLPGWKSRLLERLPGDAPTTHQGWAEALERQLSERI